MTRNMLLLGASLCCLLAGPGLAQDMPDFSAVATETCLAGASDLPSREACVGASASACMESNSTGYTTFGMGYCFDQELSYWDGRLNAAYGQVMAKDKAMDAEMASIGSSAPSLSEALRAMQRAWIPFRDASCDYERAKWGGGTGGGPATMSCLMYETARQALVLEIRLEHGYE